MLLGRYSKCFNQISLSNKFTDTTFVSFVKIFPFSRVERDSTMKKKKCMLLFFGIKTYPKTNEQNELEFPLFRCHFKLAVWIYVFGSTMFRLLCSNICLIFPSESGRFNALFTLDLISLNFIYYCWCWLRGILVISPHKYISKGAHSFVSIDDIGTLFSQKKASPYPKTISGCVTGSKPLPLPSEIFFWLAVK